MTHVRAAKRSARLGGPPWKRIVVRRHRRKAVLWRSLPMDAADAALVVELLRACYPEHDIGMEA